MELVMWILVAGAVLVGLLAVIGRTLPVSAGRFHRIPDDAAEADRQEAGGFEAVRRLIVPGAEAMVAVNEVIRATPRTVRLGGSAAAGHLSYVTRSAAFGFPDVTNVWVAGEMLHIAGHLRIGRSDLGVNRVRILAWLEQIEGSVVAAE